MDPETKKYVAELKKRFSDTDERKKLTDREILTLLISYTACSDDVLTVTDNLFVYFGSYRNCLTASYRELIAVDGVTHNTAMLILLISGIYGMRKEAPAIGKPVQDIEQLFLNSVEKQREEAFYIAVMDDDGVLLGFEKMFEGTPESVWFSVGDVLEFAAHYRARKVVVGHTHPSTVGLSLSMEDREAAEMLGRTFENLGIEFIGQVIVAEYGAKLYPYKSLSRK